MGMVREVFEQRTRWGKGACNNRTAIDDILFQRHERSRTNKRVADDGQDGAQDHNLLGVYAGVADVSDDGCYYCVRPAADDEHEAYVDGRKSKLHTIIFKIFFCYCVIFYMGACLIIYARVLNFFF